MNKNLEENIWGETKIRELPDNDVDAMAVIEKGMTGEDLCPFAWFLNLV